MASWDQPIGVKAPPRTENMDEMREYLKYLADIVAIMVKDLSFIVNGNLDVDNIRANSISADRMDVNELSAISANLGTIIAGVIRGIQIFGSYIATSETFPRTEMDVTGNFLAAIASPGTYLAITPQGPGAVPSISLVSGNSLKGFLNRSSPGGTAMGSFDGENVNLQSSASLLLQALTGNISLNPNGSLQVNGNSGFTGSVFVSSTPGGPTDKQINFHKGIRTS